MPQVNGFQAPGLAFARPAGGLVGFQRQGMDQRKKSNGLAGLVSFSTFRESVGAVPYQTAGALKTLPGDFAVLMLAVGSNPGSDGAYVGGGFTDAIDMVTTNPGSGTQGARVYYKLLTQADLDAPATIGGLGTGSCWLAIYRGGYSSLAAIGSVTRQAPDASAILQLSGTKTAASKGTLIAVADRDPGVIVGVADQGFVFRGGGVGTESQWSTYLFDDLAGSYASGATINLSGFVASNQQMGIALELR